MKSRFLYLLIAVTAIVIAFYYFSSSDQILDRQSQKPQKIVAFGDSLVQGVGSSEGNDFVSVLSREINVPIINLGRSGDTTKDALTRIDQVIAEDPTTTIVLFGGNDFLRKVPIGETFNNLEKIIKTIQESGSEVVLLGIRGGILSDGYKNRFEDLAEKTDVPFVPNVLDGLLGNQKYMSDGIHPNDEGYKIIAERVEEILK